MVCLWLDVSRGLALSSVCVLRWVSVTRLVRCLRLVMWNCGRFDRVALTMLFVLCTVRLLLVTWKLLLSLCRTRNC